MSEKDETYKDVFFDLSLRRIEKIIKKGQKYSVWADSYWHPKKENSFYRINKSGDYEGIPISDTLTLQYLHGDIENITKAEVLWEIYLEYQSTSDDTYDYTATVRADRSTAYKMKPGGPPREVKFRLINALRGRVGWSSLHDPQKIPAEQLRKFYEDLVYLEKSFSIADELIKDIDAWISSGMGMRIFCGCHRRVNLSNKTIFDFSRRGLTLDQIKQNLKCKECGKRPHTLLPPDRELNNMLLNLLTP